MTTNSTRGTLRIKLPQRVQDAMRAKRAKEQAEALQEAHKRAQAARQHEKVAARQAELRQQAAARAEGQWAAQARRNQEAEARRLAIEIGPLPPPTPSSAIIALIEGRLACPSCGLAVHDVPDATGEHTSVRVTEGRSEYDVQFLRCPPCQGRHDAAAAAIARFPGIAARIGSVATPMLAAALDALEAVHQHAPELTSPAEVSALITRLGPLGGAVQWSADDASRNGASAVVRWAHVQDHQRSEIRSAVAALLADRLDRAAPPVILGPPRDQGTTAAYAAACGFCGVGTVSVPAARVRALGGRAAASSATWTRRTLRLSTLGGKSEERPVIGWLCPRCERHADDARGATMTALERSLAEHLASIGDTETATAIRLGRTVRLRSWAATVQAELLKHRHSTSPGAEPWDYLAQTTRKAARS